MSPSAEGRTAATGATLVSGRPGAFLTAIFCGFAALLPIVSVVAPKGTVGLLLLAAILAVPTYWWARRRFPVPEFRISIALVLLLVWCAIASAWSAEPVQSLVLAIRIGVIFAAGMILFAASAALGEAAKLRVGQWLIVGFAISLAYMAAEIGLDYPLLGSFKEADPGNKAVWFNRGAVALALIAWPLTAYLWERGVGWKAYAIPVVLGIGSAFLESESATLGFAVGVVIVLLMIAIPKAGRGGRHCGKRSGVCCHALRGKGNVSPRMASGRLADQLRPAPRGDLGLYPRANRREAAPGMGIRRVAPYRGAAPQIGSVRPGPDGAAPRTACPCRSCSSSAPSVRSSCSGCCVSSRCGLTTYPAGLGLSGRPRLSPRWPWAQSLTARGRIGGSA